MFRGHAHSDGAGVLAVMYKRRGRQSEYQASIKKFLEPNKDPLKRLKSLQHGLGKLER